MISLGRLATRLASRPFSSSLIKQTIIPISSNKLITTQSNKFTTLSQSTTSNLINNNIERVSFINSNAKSTRPRINGFCSYLQNNNFHYNSSASILNDMLPHKTSKTITKRHFHAAGSKAHYLDFRHRFKTNHLRLHMLIIRRQKMKKHKRQKFRKKFKCLLAKQRLKREIAKEKTFRVELLTMIRRAETFDPKEYAIRKIAEANNKPKELSKEERLEELKELIRQNRYQVTYIKPKHKRADM